RASLLSIGMSILLLVGCPRIKPLFTVEEIDYLHPETPESSAASDPQVYTRASLINDRRQELQYLGRLLEGSEQVTFAPQIVSDVHGIEVLSASLGLSLGKVAGQPGVSSDLLGDIERAKLQVR